MPENIVLSGSIMITGREGQVARRTRGGSAIILVMAIVEKIPNVSKLLSIVIVEQST